MRATILACLVATAGVGLFPVTLPSTRAAQAAGDDSAVQQKSDEVERLKRQLEQAEKELQKVKADNERLRQEKEKQDRQQQDADRKAQQKELDRLKKENERLRKQQVPAPTSASQPAREMKPVRPMGELPPLAKGAEVEADELVGHFAADPVAAAKRYDKQVFRVKGEVERFSTGLVTRNFTVLLASPDRAATVKCRFNYIDQYRTVFTRQDARKLTARFEGGGEVDLLEVGQPVVIEGKCAGLKDGDIVFSGCRLVR